MKIIFLLLLLTFVYPVIGFSQDTIYKIDGSIVIAKVIDITKNEVRYKIGTNEEYASVVVAKNTVGYVVFKGGVMEKCNYNRIHKRIFGIQEDKFLRNNIRINLFDIAFTNLSLSYEHIFGTGKFSLKIPLSFGLGGVPDKEFNRNHMSFSTNRIYAGGLELNLYPKGQTSNNFYIGISSLAGTFYYYTKTISYNPYILTEERFEGLHLSILAHIGVNAKLSDHFTFNGKMAVGVKWEKTKFPTYSVPRIQPEIGIAYRF